MEWTWKKWTENNPFESAQAIIRSKDRRLFFHKNRSIVRRKTKLTLFWWKIEDTDTSSISRLRKELQEEAGIELKAHTIHMWLDGPIEFEKWWFCSHVFYLLLEPELADDIQNATVFNGYQDFITRWWIESWGTSFTHIKSLVDRTLWYSEIYENFRFTK